MASVRRHKSSRFWYACISLPNGKQRQFSTGLEDKAKAEVIAASAEIAARSHFEKPHQLQAALSRLALEYVPATDADPGPWLLAWAEGRKNECAPSTYRSYAITMREAAEWLAEQNIRSFSALSGKHVVAMRDMWARQNSPGTANNKIKHLRIAFKAAAAPPHKIISENPAQGVAKLNASETKRREFRPAEWEVLLPALSGEWKGMVFLGLNTGGQRINDLAILRQKNIDLAARTTTFHAAKTGKLVCLPLMQATIDALADLPSSDDPEAFIFPELAALATTSRSNQFRSILASVGLAPKVLRRKMHGQTAGARPTFELSFHSIRHTATSWLKAAGVSDGIVRAIVGHESVAISRNYTHLDLDTMRAALDKLPVNSAKP